MTVCISLSGCSRIRKAARTADVQPDIFPDYIGVTVPVNIAPLNFMMEGVEHIQAVFRIDGKEQTVVCGNEGVVDIPLDEWRDMMSKAAGSKIDVEVSAWNDANPDGIRYKAFAINVSKDEIDPWIAYRLIEPGYEAWRYMGIYQRELSSYDEFEIVSNKTTKSACVNCHHFDNRSAKRMLFHARGKNGGTIFLENGTTRKVKPEAKTVYPAWHPEGRYIAFSSNDTHQVFFGEGRQVLEVFDYSSDLVLYDTKENKVITDPRFNGEEFMETFPSWSPDGKWLYFSSAASKKMPDERKDLHYDILRVEFDIKSGKMGENVDTVYNAKTQGGSASFPRISPDGKYLLYTLAEYGTFPIWHNEADLRMMRLDTGENVDISVWNDKENTESYHSWSKNGRWVMFSSRRLDGRYTRLFIACLDKNGKPCKPFLLPQKDPRQNTLRLKSYNIPEFMDGRVEMPDNTVELFKCEDKIIKR
ncbi:MAG: hypothetical protein MR924_13500 [Prevotella sp.]|nr:hypothetical protein [Prevotella sp.]